MAYKKEGRIYETPYGKMWSVTTVLGIIDKSAPLMYWAVKQALLYIQQALGPYRVELKGIGGYKVKDADMEKILTAAQTEYKKAVKKAADIGTSVHKLIEEQCGMWVKHRDQVLVLPPGLDSRIENAFALFLQWANDVELEPLENELFVYHPVQEYAGTTDLVARGLFNKRWKKPRIYLLDTKTSKGIYDTFAPQISAYREGYRASKGQYTLEGQGIIRVGKEDGKPEFQDCSETHEVAYQTFLAAKQLYILLNGRPT